MDDILVLIVAYTYIFAANGTPLLRDTPHQLGAWYDASSYADYIATLTVMYLVSHMDLFTPKVRCTREENAVCGVRRVASPSAMAPQDPPRSRQCSRTSSLSSRKVLEFVSLPTVARTPDRRRGHPLLPFSVHHAAVRR